MKRNFTKKLAKPFRDELGHHDIPVIQGEDISSSRMVMIDTGATYDMLDERFSGSSIPEIYAGSLESDED